MPRRLRQLAVVTVAAIVLGSCNYAYGPFVARVDGPAVFTGAELGVDGLGLDPDRAMAFRWDAETDGWVQIPVQVDERHVVDFGGRPNNNAQAGTAGTVYGTSPIGLTALQYSDPDTWVGADPDPSFDADDELVFMARDVGPEAPTGAADPPGLAFGEGREIALVDPDGGTAGYAYLFYGTPSADPSAGQDLVDYDFVLDAGTYLDDYLRADGPNPESSSVSTPSYDIGFSDRWITDSLSLSSGTGVDILDGHKSRFTFATCGRSNATFADAEGAFVANIDGPVRAIRSYIGANSGPLTQRTEIFYDFRYDQITDLRVHAIPGVMSFYDWSTAAIGMSYRNSEMGSAVTVDGSPDTVPSGVPSWEYLTGPQGALTHVFAVESSISPFPTLAGVYVDDLTPAAAECWGDGAYHGASGAAITSAIPNTDPDRGFAQTFRAHETTAFWLPDMNMDAWAPLWAPDAQQDLSATITTF